jgi:hypothetical protein
MGIERTTTASWLDSGGQKEDEDGCKSCDRINEGADILAGSRGRVKAACARESRWTMSAVYGSAQRRR